VLYENPKKNAQKTKLTPTPWVRKNQRPEPGNGNRLSEAMVLESDALEREGTKVGCLTFQLNAVAEGDNVA
jgi:hypothetical protein